MERNAVLRHVEESSIRPCLGEPEAQQLLPQPKKISCENEIQSEDE